MVDSLEAPGGFYYGRGFRGFNKLYRFVKKLTFFHVLAKISESKNGVFSKK